MSTMSLETAVKIEPQEIVEIKTEVEDVELKIEPVVATVQARNIEESAVFIKQEPVWVSVKPEYENNMEQPNKEVKKEVSTSSPDRTIHDLDMLDKPLIISKKYSATKFFRKKQISEISVSTYTCNICQKHFPEMQLLINHKISDNDNCKKKIIDQNPLNPNETAVAITAIRRKLTRYLCDLCDQDFGRYSTLQKHKETHYMCHLCGQSFPTSLALAEHGKICSVIKIYVCRFCRREFYQPLTLKEHEKVHFTGNSYYCDICKEEFGQKHKLVIHSRIHGKDKHICNVCNKAYMRKSNLLAHKLIHTGPKKYACDKCDRKFTHSTLLTKHSATHRDYNPFSCDTCCKSFVLESRLEKHKMHCFE